MNDTNWKEENVDLNGNNQTQQRLKDHQVNKQKYQEFYGKNQTVTLPTKPNKFLHTDETKYTQRQEGNTVFIESKEWYQGNGSPVEGYVFSASTAEPNKQPEQTEQTTETPQLQQLPQTIAKPEQPKQLIQPYFFEKNCCLYQGDCVEVMKQMPDNYVDMIFADPPYFLSEPDEDRVPTNFPVKGTNYKGNWDVSNGFKNNFKFQQEWIKEAKRILKPEGTIWITGTHHSIYQCGVALQAFDFKILNEISWYKPRSKYYTKSYFNFAHETIIFSRKSKDSKHKHYFNATLMNKWRGDPLKDTNPENPESMRTVWQIEPPSRKECLHGRHPTQKPLQLLHRIILASSKPDAIILDPFNGSGTTAVAMEIINKGLSKSKNWDGKTQRKYIGIDREVEYLELTKRRVGGGR